jgi:hypothetical protein
MLTDIEPTLLEVWVKTYRVPEGELAVCRQDAKIRRVATPGMTIMAPVSTTLTVGPREEVLADPAVKAVYDKIDPKPAEAVSG